MLDLYTRIRERIEALNMSQEELAQLLNYKSRSSINKIERGINDIPQSKIKDFAMALHTSPEYLMGWIDDPEAKLKKHFHHITEQQKSVMDIMQNMSEDGQNSVLKYADALAKIDSGSEPEPEQK